MTTAPAPSTTKPRSRNRRAEIEELFALRKRDGLTWRQLSARSGIPVGTLTVWQQKLRKETAARFVEVETAPAPTASSPSSGFTIETASGVRVLVPADFDAAALRRLLTTVGIPC